MDEFFALMAEVSASQAGMTVLRTDCEDDDESARPVTRSDLDSRHPLDEASDSVSSDFSWHMKVAEPPGSEPKTSMAYSINNITAKEEARSLTATITLDAIPPTLRCRWHSNLTPKRTPPRASGRYTSLRSRLRWRTVKLALNASSSQVGSNGETDAWLLDDFLSRAECDRYDSSRPRMAWRFRRFDVDVEQGHRS